MPENIYKVYLCGEEEIEIGNGQFCIPITFTSANAKKTTMLKILWDHTNWDVSSAKFCVNKIEEQRMEIKRMIVEILRNVIIGGV